MTPNLTHRDETKASETFTKIAVSLSETNLRFIRTFRMK